MMAEWQVSRLPVSKLGKNTLNNKVYGDTIRKWIGVPVFVAARSLGWHDTNFSEIKEIIC